MVFTDSQILVQMRDEILHFRQAERGIQGLGNHLAVLRDQLRLSDSPWRREVTQHLVTLDSASTFHAKCEAEDRQLKEAVAHAVDRLLCLIQQKEDGLRRA
jgi:hypothetical protein